MKDKFKRFVIDKKELLVFIAVVLVVFTTVITIATIALNDVPANSVDEQTEQNDNPVVEDENEGGNNSEKPVEIVKKFALPVNGEYEVIRIFFDPNLPDDQLVSAVISTGSYMIESKGVTYKKADNSVFDVNAIYDGTVIDIVSDDLYGMTVTIKHSDEVSSVYSSLSDVCVRIGDDVRCGESIAKASTSLYDTSAGVHLHLQVKINDSYVNPADTFGKKIEELETQK